MKKIYNSAIENIMTRKSIRSFTDQTVTDEQIDIIIKAAMAAPTANNRRPYHFVVIKDQKIKDSLGEFKIHGRMISHSAVTIAVCGDVLLEESIDFIHHDCAAAVQNILLATHALDLGAVWVGIKQEDSKGWDKHVIQTLNLPKNIKPIALIPIGHPNEDKDIKDRYDHDLVHNNKW